jgi:hypothetical protein
MHTIFSLELDEIFPTMLSQQSLQMKLQVIQHLKMCQQKENSLLSD